jgi:hypothetical protein
MNGEVEEPTFLGIALNRLVAFAGPYISIAAGIIATWITNHVHILATFHVAGNDIANAVAQALVFGFSAAVVWLGQQKWLDGFQKWAYNTSQVMPPPPIVLASGSGGVQVQPSARASSEKIVPGPDDEIDEETGLPPGVTEEQMEGFGPSDPPVSS